MEFLYPAAFYGLLALPLVYLFNLYRHRRVVVKVSSHAIWREVLEKHPGTPASRRRFFNLALLLEMLVIVLLVAALASPVLPAPEGGRSYVLVIDASASMTARARGGRTRFELAVMEARAFADSLDAADHVFLFLSPAGDTTAPLGKPLEPARAAGILSNFAPTETVVDFSDAVNSAAALALAENAALVVFTDHEVPPPGGFPGARYFQSVVGGPFENVGITAFAARGNAAFIEVGNFQGAPADATLTITTGDGRTVFKTELALKANETGRGLVFSISLPPTVQLLEARLARTDGRDDLGADDAAYLFRSSETGLRIGLFGKVPRAVERALAALGGGVELVRVLGADTGADFDWRIYAGTLPAKDPGGNVLLADPPRGKFRGIAFKEKIPCRRSYLAIGSPLGKEVDFSVPGLESVRVADGDGIRPVLVVEGAATPTGALFFKEGAKGITAGVMFDVEETAWPSEPDFPLFFALIFERARSSGRHGWRALRTGVPYEARGEIFSGKFIDLTGKALTIKPPAGDALVMCRVGRAELGTPGGTLALGASLLDAEESATAGRGGTGRPGDARLAAAPASGGRPGKLWVYLFIGALAAVFLHWTVERSRKEGAGFR